MQYLNSTRFCNEKVYFATEFFDAFLNTLKKLSLRASNKLYVYEKKMGSAGVEIMNSAPPLGVDVRVIYNLSTIQENSLCHPI
jgi:hypothetical protein